MATAVTDLEAGLQAMLNLKPPGVSGSRITSLTALCVANIQSESVLIQKIYTHFKKAPGTHKLGVLYVVDSVTRKWLEQAKAQGQAINSSAQDGTYAAGVHRVTELMPVLMNDILQTAPEEQKVRIYTFRRCLRDAPNIAPLFWCRGSLNYPPLDVLEIVAHIMSRPVGKDQETS
jgi:protein NRD1